MTIKFTYVKLINISEGINMQVSLTKNEVLERFEERKSQFSDKLGQRLKPKLPIVIDTYADLSYACTDVIFAFLDTVFTEE